MKKNVLLLASVFAILIPSALSAELFHDSQNRTVKGGKSDKKEIMMSPGTYNFTLKISGEGRNPNPKLEIKQKTGSGVFSKTLYKSNYGTGTHEGKFEVEAKRTSDASGSVAASGHYIGVSGSGSAEGGYSVNTELVDANRKVKIKVNNPFGKKKITYRLKIYQDSQDQRFNQPTIGTKRLDWCKNWGHGCGEAAASYFCQEKGFSRASAWEEDRDIGNTFVLGDNKECNMAGCDGFKFISCVK